PVVEHGMSDAFRDFCADAFNVRMPLEYPPLKLTTVPAADELPGALFIGGDPANGMTEGGDDVCLFMVDDSLYAECVCGVPLKAWLKAYLPAIPKVVVTYPGSAPVVVPQRRWAKKCVDVFANPTVHHERLVHLFKSFWLPRFWSAMRQYVQVKAGTNWHTPGHNGGNAFADSPFLRGLHEAFGSMIFRADLSVSVESLGDLSSPEAQTPLSEAQKMSSEIFGSALSRYVTNGTSTSNKAMLMTLLKPGEVVLVDRNCHKSVHHAIVTSGAVPRYLPSRWNARLGVWGPVALADIEKALADAASSSPRLLVLTTCTYEGVLYPVWEVARLCEKAGVLFYADEAWAAYMGFHPFYTMMCADTGRAMRYNAVNERGGAHFAVQSTHKTMAAFSQASMIHVSMRFKALLEEDSSPQFRWLRRRFAMNAHGSFEKFTHDLHEFLRYWHSTSPHYPFLASLDVAGVQMRLEGMKLIDERLKWAAEFRERVAAECALEEGECFAGLEDIAGEGQDWGRAGFLKDPLKIVLMLKSPAACAAFKKALLKSHIQWEKATATTILFLVTVGTVEEHFEDLFRVCRLNKELIGRPGKADSGLPTAACSSPEVECPSCVPQSAAISEAVSGQVVVLPRDAALCDGEFVTLDSSVGRIASQFLVPYPPGIPVFVPGLRITEAMVALVKGVIETEGVSAVHGLFCRGAHAPYYVEVLNRDEEARLCEAASGYGIMCEQRKETLR
ncbi:MAG: aminotransferase class I/II-fold pyridoxal phosphate-dependent enzyme, partial [Kiritimatiellae bacterium]|nr:aminotransferase class I/II-fold pyridoxal phosphate-dependent enzyme [Kiritimatiellia bacterium]